MLHGLIRVWFGWVQSGGYWGVLGLMALESSVIPVPSEIVMPPAAFWAMQANGEMSMFGVIVAGTVGSYLGSIANYLFCRWIGPRALERYGKYVLLPPAKVALADAWVQNFGPPGIFFARLLPVVRHLISIPAGIFQMPVRAFSLMTILGAGLWCGVLSWFGARVLGAHPELLESPDGLRHAVQSELRWFVLAVVGLAFLYGLVAWFRRRLAPAVR